MTSELLTLVADPVFQTATFSLAGAGLLGAASSIIALTKLKDSSPLAEPAAVMTAVLSFSLLMGGTLVGFGGGSPGDRDRWAEETRVWLASEHDLTLEQEPEEDLHSLHRRFQAGEVIAAVDSEGDRHAIQLVPYDRKDLPMDVEGDSYQLVDVLTEEPFVDSEN